jgi:hypothetical protein
MAQVKMAVWGFAVVSVLCFITAVIPVFKGSSLNVVLLACGVVFLIVAVAAHAKNARTNDNGPPAA